MIKKTRFKGKYIILLMLCMVMGLATIAAQNNVLASAGSRALGSESINMINSFSLKKSRNSGSDSIFGLYSDYFFVGTGMRNLGDRDYREHAFISSKYTMNLSRPFTIAGTIDTELQPDGITFGLQPMQYNDGTFSGNTYETETKNFQEGSNLGTFGVLGNAAFMEIDMYKNIPGIIDGYYTDGNVTGSEGHNPHIAVATTNGMAEPRTNKIVLDESIKGGDWRYKFVRNKLSYQIKYNPNGDVLTFQLSGYEGYSISESIYSYKSNVLGGSNYAYFFLGGAFNQNSSVSPSGDYYYDRGGYARLATQSIKYTDVDVSNTFIGAYNDTQIIDSKKYSTYGRPDGIVRTVYEVKNRINTNMEISVPYKIDTNVTSRGGRVVKSYYADSPTATSGTSISSTSGSINLRSQNIPRYIITEYQMNYLGSSNSYFDTSLKIGEEGQTQYTSSGIAYIVGKPTLKSIDSKLQIYQTSDYLGQDKIPEVENYKGVVGKVSGDSTEKNYTGKNVGEYNVGDYPMYLQRSEFIDMDSGLDVSSGSKQLPNLKGRYKIGLTLRDMSFGNPTLLSAMHNRYINILESSEFSSALKISDDRTHYIDVELNTGHDLTIENNQSNLYVDSSKNIITSKFKEKYKIEAKKIVELGILEDIPESNIAITISETDKLSISKKTPGSYDITFSIMSGSNTIVSTIKKLVVLPDYTVKSVDGTRYLYGVAKVAHQSTVKDYTKDNFKLLKETLGIKSWYYDKTNLTLTEEDPDLISIELSDSLKNNFDQGKVSWNNVISKVSTKGIGDSQAVISDLKYIVVANDGAYVSLDKDFYIYAEDKVVDTVDMKEMMNGKSDNESIDLLKNIMKLGSVSINGTDHYNSATLTIINPGKTLDNIKNGDVGKYDIKFTVTSDQGPEKLTFTKVLTIFNNDASWGFTIPKTMDLDNNHETCTDMISIFAKSPYTEADLSDDFKVDISVKSINGYKLWSAGETNPPINKEGVYTASFQLLDKVGGSVGTAQVLNTTTGTNSVELAKLSKANPKMRLTTTILTAPIERDVYEDRLTFTVKMEGIAIDPSKIK